MPHKILKPAAINRKSREKRRASLLRSALGCLSVLAAGAFTLADGLAAVGAPAASVEAEEIYRRAALSFQEADFSKPVERDGEALSFKLAPLLLQEIHPGAGAEAAGAGFGTPLFTNGTLALDTSRPVVYFAPDTIVINGKPHLRFAYVWCYTLKPTQGQGGAPPVQGVRLTLNSAGEPVIWEVLADPSGAEIFFVAHSLEAAAAAQFGKPLPGRRYASEASTNDAPAVVVARVIEDGPVPMGPIVYLRAGTHAVGTLICRCMPAQAKTLRSTVVYDLLPFPTDAAQLNRLREGLRSKDTAAFWRGDQGEGVRLERCLRLPEEF
jgi:hypothetical protein